MKIHQRFWPTLLAGFLATVLLGNGLPWGILAQAADPLEVEQVGTPENTLPLPYPEAPDGTLKLPTPPAEAEADDAETVDAAVDEVSTEAGEWIDESEVESLWPDLPPEVAHRNQLLMEADRLYLAGEQSAAEALYREAKDPAWETEETVPVSVTPITDPADLPPGGAVYWREAQAGADSGIESRMLVPLELLVKEYPEFLPGYALYAEYLLKYDRVDEAVAMLEDAIERYPFHPDLLKAQTRVQMAREQWLEAAITARQFAVLNPNHPDKGEMETLSQENLDRFRAAMNERLTGNLVTNIITGAAGYLLTGGLIGPFSAINSTMVLLQGESGLGQQVANQALEQLPILEDDTVNRYVDDMGQKLAALAGRDEFDYEFHIVMDDSLNAFALPGGKIFINAGALMKTNSEAELAGLLSHEISHAVLSHGFQMVTQGNLTSSLASLIPIPEVASIAANLVVSGYSREMERQADVLGTQILAANRYAADGLHNLMVTLQEENGNGPGITWLSTHPATSERVSYLKRLVDQGGFTRYAYEGIEQHLKIQRRVEPQLEKFLEEEAAEEGRRYR